MRLNKPVLALVLTGEALATLAHKGGGFVVDPADTALTASMLGRVYAKWDKGTLGRHVADQALLKRYDRRFLAGELAAIFARLADAPQAR